MHAKKMLTGGHRHLMTQHNLSAFGLDLRAGHNVLYLLLLILVFSVAVTTGTWDIGNSRVVLYHELVFIVAYILVFRGEMPLLQDIRQRPFVVALVLLWAVSITVSLWQSPLQLRHLTCHELCGARRSRPASCSLCASGCTRKLAATRSRSAKLAAVIL